MQRNLGSTLVVILITILISVGYFYYKNNPGLYGDTASVSLEQQVTLKEGQSVELRGSGLKISAVEFFNNPCQGVCIWSGVGIKWRYEYKGLVKEGIDLSEAFGYRIREIKTDHETFVTIKIETI